MFKNTPNPPDTDDVSPYESTDSKKFNEAADRALDYYLKPAALNEAPRKPSTLYFVAPDTDDETLLVNASQDLESINSIAAHLAFECRWAAARYGAGNLPDAGRRAGSAAIAVASVPASSGASPLPH